VSYLWKFQALVSCVPIELVLKEVRERTEHLLDNKELVDLTVSREKRLTIHELSHDASNSPNVYFFTIR
jgi:hypothetical protein